MGNCYSSNNVSKITDKKFIDSNLIDKEFKIFLGIYSCPDNSSKNLNIQVNQGIWIGKFSNKIYKLKFGIYHQSKNKLVELYFENNIKLVLMKNIDTNEIDFILTCNDIKIIEKIGMHVLNDIKYNDDYIKINKNINVNIINNFKYIANNSEHIDLINNLKKN